MARRKQPGRGCVIERPSKEHGTVFQIRWRINNGPAKYETIGPDRQEAEQALALRLAEINRGTYRERHDVTFHEFAADWFRDVEALQKPATVDDYRITLECHLLPFFGDYRLGDIGPGLIRRYVSEKVAEHRDGEARVAELERKLAAADRSWAVGIRKQLNAARLDRGLSNRSINKTLTRLSQILQVAVEDESYLLDRNPARSKRLRLPPEDHERRVVQRDQVEPLLDALERPEHRTLVATMMLAGLRIGEALALRWGDVDLLAGRLTVRRNLYRGVEGTPKTGKVKVVPLVSRQLLDWLVAHKHGSAFAGDGDLVFCTRRGTHLNPSNVRGRILRPAIERANAALDLAGRPRITVRKPHDLRHTFGSLLGAQGEALAAVAHLMRHDDTSVTARTYTHVLDDSLVGIAERLDAAIFGEASRKPGRKSGDPAAVEAPTPL